MTTLWYFLWHHDRCQAAVPLPPTIGETVCTTLSEPFRRAIDERLRKGREVLC